MEERILTRPCWWFFVLLTWTINCVSVAVRDMKIQGVMEVHWGTVRLRYSNRRDKWLLLVITTVIMSSKMWESYGNWGLNSIGVYSYLVRHWFRVFVALFMRNAIWVQTIFGLQKWVDRVTRKLRIGIINLHYTSQNQYTSYVNVVWVRIEFKLCLAYKTGKTGSHKNQQLTCDFADTED